MGVVVGVAVHRCRPHCRRGVAARLLRACGSAPTGRCHPTDSACSPPTAQGSVALHGNAPDPLAPAVVFQRIRLVGRRTVLDNLCVGALGRLPLPPLPARLFPMESREEAMARSERVGLAARAHDRAGRLSDGQQQRAAVARALCRRPEVILAGEPVSVLDPPRPSRSSNCSPDSPTPKGSLPPPCSIGSRSPLGLHCGDEAEVSRPGGRSRPSRGPCVGKVWTWHGRKAGADGWARWSRECCRHWRG
ncbi:ATP-binding cassette domain-containing protein [Kitasatospora purpeofusca]|uniref:ATP-binding cassette domain-containing protein n=1 Tax=Kitasatospora purpeofusca TaxID=67352 RepID=UPI0033D97069